MIESQEKDLSDQTWIPDLCWKSLQVQIVLFILDNGCS